MCRSVRFGAVMISHSRAEGNQGTRLAGDKLEVQIVAARGASLAHQDDAVDERGLERGAFGGVGLIVGGTRIEDVLDTP